MEYRVCRPDGTVRWVFAKGRPNFEQKGADRALISFDGTLADITERKQVEDRLQVSETRFRQLADAMPQIVWSAGPDGLLDYYNRRWYEYIGLNPGAGEEAAWDRYIHVDDLQETYEAWSSSVASGEPYEREFRIRGASGDYRWVLVRALPVRDNDAQVVKWFGTCTDIDDFKRIEADRQKFVLLAQNSPDFIGMFDLEGVPFYLNPAAAKQVGLDSPNELSRIQIQDFFFPEDRPLITENFLPEVFRNGYGTTEIRFRHFGTETATWISFSVFTLTDSTNRTIGLAMVSQDVSLRRQMEQDLRALAANLSEADHRKDEFLATLAYELRNPLAPIQTGLQVIRLAAGDTARIGRTREMMERQPRSARRVWSAASRSACSNPLRRRASNSIRGSSAPIASR